jgi:hypothetical protein
MPRRAATAQPEEPAIPEEDTVEAPVQILPDPLVPAEEQSASEDHDDEKPNLAVAITLMTEELRRRGDHTPRAVGRVKEPDTFDGSDNRKLNNFILLCNLYFRNNPAYYDDEPKVTFALSYLRGTALEYFEPSILDSDETPDWMDNWSAFIRTLRLQFGPIDPTADAEHGLDHLKMHDNQHIVKYNVEFNRLSVATGWDDSVLRHRYYSGLAERIKDIMGQQGKPATLEAMKALAHSIDSRHWERSREKSRSDRGKSDSNKEKSDNKDKSDNKKTSNPTSGNNQNSNKNKAPKASTSSGNTATISDKLGKDGKLTPQERQRRFENHLCMFCGGLGHTAKDCPKSSSSASKAKARAAQATEAVKEDSDSKKG